MPKFTMSKFELTMSQATSLAPSAVPCPAPLNLAYSSPLPITPLWRVVFLPSRTGQNGQFLPWKEQGRAAALGRRRAWRFQIVPIGNIPFPGAVAKWHCTGPRPRAVACAQAASAGAGRATLRKGRARVTWTG
jgi:hypothetical protein